MFKKKKRKEIMSKYLKEHMKIVFYQGNSINRNCKRELNKKF